MERCETIRILETEKAYMDSHGGDSQSIALHTAIKVLKTQERIEKSLEEMISEHNLCYEYISKEDMKKDKTEHEKLALEIASSCMQTLGYLIDSVKQN